VRRLHYLDAERALLGSVLLAGDEVLDRLLLEPEEFFDLRHREIFSAMRRLRLASQPAGDPQLLEAALGDRMAAIGGIAFLSGLLTTTAAVPDHAEHYQQLIRRGALTRATITALAELQSSELEGVELLGRVLEATSALARCTDDPAVPIGVAVKEAFQALLEAHATPGHTWGLPTGFGVLDAILGGLQVGVVTILAGRPAMGKSSLARSIAGNANLLGAECGVHVFTPEDSRQTYALRALSDASRVPLERMRALTVKRDEFDQLRQAASELWARSHWLIDDSAGIASEDVALRVRKHKRENKTKLVVVDYVQLLRERRVPQHDLRLQVEVAAANLVHLARSEEVCVLLLSQLSRDCEKREDKRPLLSDLRESGALEQIAEAALFVYRDEVYDPHTSSQGITEVLVRKNKNGRTGPAELRWDAPTATHRPLSRRDDEPRVNA
jgi:replicative DNA helicase